VVLFRNFAGNHVRLDGRVRQVQDVGGTKFVGIDFIRSSGFHHLHVEPGYDFWFGTEDSKLRLDGIEEMLRYMRTEGLGWSGQLLFSDGSYGRDPHVIYGWLDQHADSLLRHASQIARYPRRGRDAAQFITSKGAKRLNMRSTLALLRRGGRDLVEESAQGSILVGGKRYVPRKAVVERMVETTDIQANRRCVWVLNRTKQLIEEVQPHLTGQQEISRCREWTALIDVLLFNGALSVLTSATRLWFPPLTRTPEETTDPHYAGIFGAYQSLSSLTEWSVTREQRLSYSYIDFSDQIYQAFVAFVVAVAINASPTAAALGLRQPALTSENIDVYYDTEPPSSIMRSWRALTSRPDSPKPDFLFHYKSEGAVALGDAKYRNDGRRASESSRRELMLYMQAFGLTKAIIFYPPEPVDLHVHSVRHDEYCLYEMPIRPSPALATFLAQELLPVLDAAKRVPSWRRSKQVE
jgi:hypothetical protein